jgi:hypothetical protein
MDELIAQFEKNASEVVRVSLTEFRGRTLVDVRVYYTNDEGEHRPTRKGISLAVDGYLDFRNAIARLDKVLLDRKLVTADDIQDALVLEND